MTMEHTWPLWVRKTQRALKFALSIGYEGLIHVGFAYWMMPPDYFAARNAYRAKQEQDEKESRSRSRPGPAHPERLVREEPLSPAEAGLWAQLSTPIETDRGRTGE